MKVIYIDEYEEELFSDNYDQYLPRIGDTVVVEQDRFQVVDVVWDLPSSIILVTLGEPKSKKLAPATNDVSGRLDKINRAIVDVNKRQDASEKKNRNLSEQLVSIRTHIRSQQKPKAKTE